MVRKKGYKNLYSNWFDNDWEEEFEIYNYFVDRFRCEYYVSFILKLIWNNFVGNENFSNYCIFKLNSYYYYWFIFEWYFILIFVDNIIVVIFDFW